jgi:hypothetical protein
MLRSSFGLLLPGNEKIKSGAGLLIFWIAFSVVFIYLPSKLTRCANLVISITGFM